MTTAATAGAALALGPRQVLAARAHSAAPEAAGRRVRLGNVTLNVVDVGTGPAALMLHGFPGSSADWTSQIRALVGAGYRVIAPDLLGLGASDKPLEPEHYTVAQDVARTLDLMSALGVQKARIVCHDRGGAIGWNIAANHPERVERLVAMTVGHSNVARSPSIEQREKSWYMLLFQFSNAEQLLREDDWALFRAWLHHHAAVDAWIANLSAIGALTAGLGWYRANRRPDRPPTPPLADVSVPALGLWTPDDHYLLPEYMLETYRYMRGPWRTERIDGASHFMMLDQPDRINRLLLEFLRAA